MATMALAANAQSAVYKELEYADLGLSSEDATSVEAGTSLGSDPSGNCFTTGFDDQCKLVGVATSGYNVISVNGTEHSISGGYQGNTTAKDEDGLYPANTLKPATQGSVLMVEAAQDGYIYVVGKFSNNKQYVVFEDRQAIGYTVVIDGTAAGQDATAVTANVEGDDPDEGHYRESTIDKLGSYNGLGDDSANNGCGFIKFKCSPGSKYAVHACGSKLTQCGTIFSTTGTENIILKGKDAEGMALTDVVLEGVATAMYASDQLCVQNY